MAHIVVGVGAAAALLKRQPRLRAIQCLNLALLVHAQNHRLVRRMEIHAHDVGELLDKVLVAGKLKGASPVWLQPVQLPNALHGFETQFLGLGHRATAPMSLALGLGMNSRPHHCGHLAPAQGGFAPPAGGDLAQSRRPAREEAFFPAPDGRLTYFQTFADGLAALALAGQQNNPAPQHHTLRSIGCLHPAFELLNIGCIRFDS